jgi:acetyltransferase-like isoleucine patch superfamily enzyme
MPVAFVHPTADVEDGADIGQGTTIWRHTHVRSDVVIGDECVIGAHVYVDKEVVIGNRVKVQNEAMLFGPARIADGCFIGPGVCLTNDRVPRAVNPDGTPKDRDDWEAKGVVLEEGASVGAMATVLSGIRIGAWAMVGAGAVVSRDVQDHSLVVGVPATVIGQVCKCGERLRPDLVCSCGRRYLSAGHGDGAITEAT